jgi:hypothetical protein
MEALRQGLWNLLEAHHPQTSRQLFYQLFPVTAEYDVSLMPTRGFPSKRFVHDAAELMEAQGKPAYVYYFGDWNPSGNKVGKNVEASLARYAADAGIRFERVAVNQEQIARYNLPTRLVDGVINQHIDRDKWEFAKQQEAEERRMLVRTAERKKR